VPAVPQVRGSCARTPPGAKRAVPVLNQRQRKLCQVSMGQRDLCQDSPRTQGAVPGLTQGQRELCWGPLGKRRAVPGLTQGRGSCAGVPWGRGELCQGSPRAEGAVPGLHGAWQLCCDPLGQWGVGAAGLPRRCPAKDPVVPSAPPSLCCPSGLPSTFPGSPTCCYGPLRTHPGCQQSRPDRNGLKPGGFD